MANRTVPPEEKAIKKTFTLPPEDCAKLERLSAHTGIPQSGILRQLLANYDETQAKGLSISG